MIYFLPSVSLSEQCSAVVVDYSSYWMLNTMRPHYSMSRKTHTGKQIKVCVSLLTSPSLISLVMLLVADAGQGPAGDACRAAAARCRCSTEWEAQGHRGEDQREKLKHGVWTIRTPWPEEINNPICDLPSGTGSGAIKLPGAQIYAFTLLNKYFRKECCGTDLCAS